MIYTVTLNPSLDYVVDVKDFSLGTVNRSAGETVMPGGKGINVSIMLSRLGCETQALGFLAGFTGEEIRRSLHEMGIPERFQLCKNGFSRINIKLRGEKETEINGAGPELSADEARRFLECIADAVRDGDTLVLSGSIPGSLSRSVYCDIVRRLPAKDVRIVADVAGDLLSDVLLCKPFLIKPNHHELGALFGVEIRSREEAAFYAKKLCERGARNVLVSLAEQGAILVTDERVYYAEAPQGKTVNSVGAGDSSVAGFLAGFLRTGDPVHALSLAVAAGSATAFSTGIASAEDVYAQLARVRIIGEERR